MVHICRYSPYNFKKNAARSDHSETQVQQKFNISVASFSIPIPGIENKIEMKSSKISTSIEKWESLFSEN